MKGRFFLIAFTVAVLVSMLSVPETSADGFYYGDFDDGTFAYEIDEGTGTAAVMEVLDDPPENLVIPDSVVYGSTSYPVTIIRMGAISTNGIRSVKIGNNITEIDSGAFVSDTIERFIAPDNPASPFIVEDDVLYKSTPSNRTLIRYPSARDAAAFSISDNVESIYEGAFLRCSKLTEVNFTGTPIIREIRSSTFMNCSELTRINYSNSDGYNHLPSSILVIGSFSFQGCTKLGSIMMPDDLRLIEGYAFSECGFKKVFLDYQLYYIGEMAFSNCPNFEAFESDYGSIPTGSSKELLIENGILYEVDDDLKIKTIVCYPGGIGDTEYTMPEDMTNIAPGAYFGNKHLRTVNFNAKVSDISYGAFSECTELETVNMSDSVIFIDMLAFDNCYKLSKVTGWDNVTEIEASAFNSTALTEITLPSGIKAVNMGAFANSQLVKVTVPDSAVKICYNAFNGCLQLTDIYFEGDRMEFEDGALNIGLDEDHKAAFTAHIINTASIPTNAVDDEFTDMTVDKEGERPYPYENLIGVAFCLLILFGIIRVIKEV